MTERWGCPSRFQMCNAEQVLAQARKRKRRTSIETNVKGTLESFFRKCVKPSPQEISQIAEDLNLDKDVGWGGLRGGCLDGCGSQAPASGQFSTGVFTGVSGSSLGSWGPHWAPVVFTGVSGLH